MILIRKGTAKFRDSQGFFVLSIAGNHVGVSVYARAYQVMWHGSGTLNGQNLAARLTDDAGNRASLHAQLIEVDAEISNLTGVWREWEGNNPPIPEKVEAELT